MITTGVLAAANAAKVGAPDLPDFTTSALKMPGPNAPRAAADSTRLSFVTECLLPSPDVTPYVMTFFSVQCDRARLDFMQPATSGLLLVLIDGTLELRTRDGHSYRSHPTSLVTSLTAAAHVACEGPLHLFGAALSPIGWAALTGRLSAETWANRVVEASTLLGAGIGALGDSLAQDFRDGIIGLPDMAARMARYIAAQARHVPPQHQAVVSAVAEWLGGSLSPRIEDLIAATAYSPRQLQRLISHYHGLSPLHLARKYRAMRAAALLYDPDTPRDQIAFVEDHFYDQPHMIREIRHFAGCTPGQLAQVDHPALKALLDLQIYARIWPKRVEMPRGVKPYCDPRR